MSNICEIVPAEKWSSGQSVVQIEKIRTNYIIARFIKSEGYVASSGDEVIVTNQSHSIKGKVL